MFTPKNETEGLLLSDAKNCETLNEQTHRKRQNLNLFNQRKLPHLNI